MNTQLRRWIEWIVLAMVAVRPSLDVFTDAVLLPAPLRLNPASFLGLALIGLGAIWFFLLTKEERDSILKQPITIALIFWLLALLLWAIIPFVKHGAERLAGMREWIRLLSYLPLYAILFHLAIKGNSKRILHVLFISLILPTVVGYYQILFHQGAMIKGVHRITGTFVHPNPFSFYIVLMMGITYWKLRWSAQRIFWGAVLLVELGLLLSTFSFTGAAMFGVLLFGCALGEKRAIRLAAVGILIVFALGFVVTNTGWQRLIDESKMESLDEVERTGKETTSLIWRLLNWRFLIRTWSDSPWVGYGLATSSQINPMKNPEGVGSDPHNDYIRYLAETGVVGAVFWIALLIAVGVGIRQAIRKAQTAETRNFAWVTLALYGAWLIGGVNDNLITATAYQFSLWAVFALAVGLSQTEAAIPQPQIEAHA
ncbi:MAG: O-antigen ligase family protein [Candidatus Omnitrophota bacterium]|jgi:O-antigen ligase|nr:MAG: O-antigen ligase family protein [Candidatus Omnitrophota bacterium]